jgi:hypothetical protein
MTDEEIFVSLDVETNGPVPGLYSMLSLGAAAFRADGEMIGTFYRTICPIVDGDGHPDTMAWWRTQPAAWAEVNARQRPAIDVSRDFGLWLEGTRSHGRLTAAASPAAFDFPFVNYYMHCFIGANPLGYSCLDIRSYVNGIARRPGHRGKPEALWARIKAETDTEGLRAHVALDDAIEQGRTLMTAMRIAREMAGGGDEMRAKTTIVIHSQFTKEPDSVRKLADQVISEKIDAEKALAGDGDANDQA